MFEIKEKILEPSKIYVSSSFLLKIRVKSAGFYKYSDYISEKYVDLINKTYEQVLYKEV